MKDINSINNPIVEKHSILNLLSLLMIVVIMFQPFYSIIIETLDNPQDISLIDKELSDSEEDDNQEEETEKNKEKLIELNQFDNSNITLKKGSSITSLSNLKDWNNHITGVITPPPESV